ncbi:hypothetical protein V6N13_136969 [Hibiscus sabdariffa]
MAPLTKKTIQLSTHRHPLTEVGANTQFLCDGCQTPGSGTRYRCQPCDFDLHLHCANSPEPKKTIKHFLHYHPLTEYSGNIPAYCDGCRTPCSGTWYRCDACQFDLHHHCANSPVEVSYPLPSIDRVFGQHTGLLRWLQDSMFRHMVSLRCVSVRSPSSLCQQSLI